MRVENGRKRASSEGGQSNPDRAESGSRVKLQEGGQERKRKKEENKQAGKFSLSVKNARKEKRSKRLVERKMKQEEGDASGGEVEDVRGYPRTFSWVTNLYEFAWFIGRKFNNGRPNHPILPQKKGCGERLPADSRIYDALT